MDEIKIPAGYHSDLNLHDTQVAIKTVKDFFQQTLAQKLNLLRVSAPVFVSPSSGLNDNLNGVERPVFTRAAGQSPFVPARDLSSCRHNHEKSAQRASYDLYDDRWILFF